MSAPYTRVIDPEGGRMAGLSDLMEGLPDIGGLVKNFDVGSIVGDLTNLLGGLDIGELLEAVDLSRLSNLFGDLDPLALLGKVDLSGVVSSVGEAALDLIGTVMGAGKSGPALRLVS